MIAFLFLFLFALVFVLSYTDAIQHSRYGQAVNLAGQIGMGASIVLFFILPKTKESPRNKN